MIPDPLYYQSDFKSSENKELNSSDLPERKIYKSMNSFRFRQDYHKMKHTSSFRIFFQRFTVLNFIIKNLYCLFFSKDIYKSDDDVIVIVKKPKMNEKKFKDELSKYNLDKNLLTPTINSSSNNKLDIESGADIGDIDDIEEMDVVNDDEFIKFCYQASKICWRYASTFRIFEIVCRISEAICIVFLPLSNFLYIHEHAIVIIICLCGPFIILSFTCEFSKLEDKYAALSSRFRKLTKTKTDDKFEKYNILVKSFRNNWVFSDFIRYNEIDYETQYNVDIE